MQLPSVT